MLRFDPGLVRLAFRRAREWFRDFVRFGRLIEPDDKLAQKVSNCKALRVALVCIAKDEDNYIDEWIEYHLKMGVDEIFIYQNDWRASLKHKRNNVHLIEFDGSCRQLPAYNDFIVHRSDNFDFAIFIDVDEFICLVRDSNIKTFLSNYVGYGAIGLNWRLFGDNGLSSVQDGDYSLVRRFTRCGKKLNRHIKTILNLHAIDREEVRFVSPHHLNIAEKGHFTVSVDKRYFIADPINRHFDYKIAWINHYQSKTIEEFKTNKCSKGRCDCPRDSKEQNIQMKNFAIHNENDVVNTIARDFFVTAGQID